ncbi:sugar phosphate isomerase/epimerase family protein [Intestinirhabdus alba]|jgi:sugar phosphate isomerase/epimerase|uniref:TIM barrel protein n=1 Tax=Intestinirhabdus alba TaxID=2899544 RepID=A0A6L6IJ09_9ENTR|nr:TIM barrel protein [Intestinirhabdus alba]MTH44703.1 TIM barrel protein [Intestinirhabdus alba]
MNMRTLSLAALTLLDVSPAEQVRIAASTGFTGVGIRLLPATPQDPDYHMLGDTPAVRETLAALRDTGIDVTDVEIVRLTPDFALNDTLQTFLETAARLGARQVLVAGNDDNASRSADNLAQLGQAGKAFGLTMNLEPMPWTAVRTLADARRLIAASGQPEVGILIDAMHFWRAGESLATLSQLPESCLNYMQLCDAPAAAPTSEQELIRQAREARNVPGEGGLNLHALMAALPAGLPVSVEVPLSGAQGALPASERARLLFNAARRYLQPTA